MIYIRCENCGTVFTEDDLADAAYFDDLFHSKPTNYEDTTPEDDVCPYCGSVYLYEADEEEYLKYRETVI